MDIEKAFDSWDQNFLISTLGIYGFGKNVIFWVKILLKDQESGVINSGTTTKYFSLGRGARQGYPVSGILFVLALEVFFIFINRSLRLKEWQLLITTNFTVLMLMIQPFS